MNWFLLNAYFILNWYFRFEQLRENLANPSESRWFIVRKIVRLNISFVWFYYSDRKAIWWMGSPEKRRQLTINRKPNQMFHLTLSESLHFCWALTLKFYLKEFIPIKFVHAKCSSFNDLWNMNQTIISI